MTQPVNNIRIQDYPTLEEGNTAFPDAEYSIEHRMSTEQPGMILEHCLKGARLIHDLLKSENAQYACAISSPKAGYRELHVSSGQEQTLHWDIKNFGDPPCFTPMVVISQTTTMKLSASEHNVHALWDNATVIFRRGARLAVHSPFRLADPDLSGMVEFVPDEDMENGTLKARVDASLDFMFRISCHPDFHARYQRAVADRVTPENASVLVVTACLSILQNQYAEDDGEQGMEVLS